MLKLGIEEKIMNPGRNNDYWHIKFEELNNDYQKINNYYQKLKKVSIKNMFLILVPTFIFLCIFIYLMTTHQPPSPAEKWLESIQTYGDTIVNEYKNKELRNFQIKLCFRVCNNRLKNVVGIIAESPYNNDWAKPTDKIFDCLCQVNDGTLFKKRTILNQVLINDIKRKGK